MVKVLKALWIVASIGVLLVTLFYYKPEIGQNVDLIMIYGMLFLAFPSSLLVAGLFVLVGYLEDSFGVSLLHAHYGQTMIFVIWLCFFVVGYAQWFKLLPFLLGKYRTRRSQRDHAS